jgi:hypothetical protein
MTFLCYYDCNLCAALRQLELTNGAGPKYSYFPFLKTIARHHMHGTVWSVEKMRGKEIWA